MLEQQRSPSEALTVSVLNSQSQVTNKPLRDSVKQALRNYLSQLDGQDVNDLYELVLAEVEHPMLDMIMQYTRGNQTRAANMLGINRGTLRKKIEKIRYGLIKISKKERRTSCSPFYLLNGETKLVRLLKTQIQQVLDRQVSHFLQLQVPHYLSFHHQRI